MLERTVPVVRRFLFCFSNLPGRIIRKNSSMGGRIVRGQNNNYFWLKLGVGELLEGANI